MPSGEFSVQEIGRAVSRKLAGVRAISVCPVRPPEEARAAATPSIELAVPRRLSPSLPRVLEPPATSSP